MEHEEFLGMTEGELGLESDPFGLMLPDEETTGFAAENMGVSENRLNP